MPNNFIETHPYNDQKPGTSGLRKKVSVFQQEHYLENFVQSILNIATDLKGNSLVLGGDGRFYNLHAIQVILKMAAANGIKHVIVGKDGLLSTPAVSCLIRKYKTAGGIVLSASHNPGGVNGDFGIKYNINNGGPAPTSFTDAVYTQSKEINDYSISQVSDIDISKEHTVYIDEMRIEVVSPVTDYSELMESLFDFNSIKHFITSNKNAICFDAMHAVTGPYAKYILQDLLSAKHNSVINGQPLEDFGGGHPDPNLAHTQELLGILNSNSHPPLFGAASDGDGDRNMIIGQNFFVNPSDSLAIMAANAHLISGYKNGIKGVARSLPTSRAVDKVAADLGVECYETPTGWKYFGNLLDADKITLCGEESFGSGSNHIREKDGLWAVLFWLNLLAIKNQTVEQITRSHWEKYGRHYYTRHDYEAIDINDATQLINKLRETINTLSGDSLSGQKIMSCDDFSYTDPIDNSEAKQQGIRIIFEDESRIIYRLSGTGTEGATLRVYIERYVANVSLHNLETQDALSDLINISKNIASIEKYTSRVQPDVIT